eukprot:300186-Hanusia_phi.AAC.2
MHSPPVRYILSGDEPRFQLLFSTSCLLSSHVKSRMMLLRCSVLVGETDRRADAQRLPALEKLIAKSKVKVTCQVPPLTLRADERLHLPCQKSVGVAILSLQGDRGIFLDTVCRFSPYAVPAVCNGHNMSGAELRPASADECCQVASEQRMEEEEEKS